MLKRPDTEQIIERTFKFAYDEANFIAFISTLFDNYTPRPLKIDVGAEKEFIKSAKSYGMVTLKDNKKIEIMAVELTKLTSVSRARIRQRSFISKRLKNESFAQGALVAFYNEDEWRFSFVKIDYVLTAEGVDTIESPVKRYSYLVGENEPNHTCQTQMLNLILNKSLSMKDLEDAFEIEKVTKEFYEDYKNLYLELHDEVQKQFDRDSKLVERVNDIIGREDSVEQFTVEFCKKLLGQIVFLYFLQKKGWLGVERNQNWGSGSRTFVYDTFRDYRESDFFSERLEPLFYGALSKKNPNDYSELFQSRIPFLNGGLFEPIYDYLDKGIRIKISNNLLSCIFENFNRYNFTVKEDEPLEKEIAVDPEMLGKVFENLLDVRDRKSKGAFYTPREIVHYMCQESIKSYLFNNSKELSKSREKVEKLFNEDCQLNDNEKNIADQLLSDLKVVDPAAGSGAFLLGMLNEIVRLRTVINNSNDTYAVKRSTIENSIYGVDIMPSATDICKLRLWLSLIVDENDNVNPLPNLDYKIMCGNSLLEKYKGKTIFTDISPKKTEKQLHINHMKSKRNELRKKRGELQLDTKKSMQERQTLLKEIDAEIRKLDSKIKDTSVKKSHFVFTTDLDEYSNGQYTPSEHVLRLQEYRETQHEYYNETDPLKKKELRGKIEGLEWIFVSGSDQPDSSDVNKYKKGRSKPFFLWKLYYSDVFETKGGFDIVVGNPPFVTMQNIGGNNPDEHEAYNVEGYRVLNSNGDLYWMFYEKGMSLLNQQGSLCYISSNKWMRNQHANHLRNYFISDTKPLLLIDFANRKIFGATVEVNILLLTIGKNDEEVKVKSCIATDICLSKLSVYFEQNSILCDFKKDKAWTITSDIESSLMKKIENIGEPLKNWDVTIYRGILTGFNDGFLIDGKTKDELIKADPKSAEIIRPILRGRDIDRYRSKFADSWIIATFPSKKYDIDLYPAVKKYLLSFDIRKLEQTGKKYTVDGCELKSRKKTNNKWFETQDSIGYWDDFSKQKIIWGEISDRPKFALDLDGEFFVEATSFFMIGKSLEFLLIFLNSSISKYVFKKIGTTTGVGTTRWKKFKIEALPVPKPSLEIERSFLKLLNEFRGKESSEEFKNKTDKMIYELFELTPNEIHIIENGV